MEYMIDRDLCLMIFQENDKRKNKMKGGCEWINKIGEIKIKKTKNKKNNVCTVGNGNEAVELIDFIITNVQINK